MADECVLDTETVRAFVAGAGDGSLSLFSLVVPPEAETPVHDHLAWGLVGLYQGAQDEEVFAQRDGSLELVERRALVAADFYAPIPPRDDVRSAVPRGALERQPVTIDPDSTCFSNRFSTEGREVA